MEKSKIISAGQVKATEWLADGVIDQASYDAAFPSISGGDRELPYESSKILGWELPDGSYDLSYIRMAKSNNTNKKYAIYSLDNKEVIVMGSLVDELVQANHLKESESKVAIMTDTLTFEIVNGKVK